MHILRGSRFSSSKAESNMTDRNYPKGVVRALQEQLADGDLAADAAGGKPAESAEQEQEETKKAASF
jgi:hypothetical protein